MNEIKALRRKRAVHKGKITVHFKSVNESQGDFQKAAVRDLVEQLLIEIQKIDAQISELFNEFDEEEVLSDEHVIELEKQSDYVITVKGELLNLAPKNHAIKNEVVRTEREFDLKLPKLQCGLFSGEGNNELEYFSFLQQFDNVVGNRTNLCDSTKLTYLKSFLRGYALKVVQHLSILDGNYAVARTLLEKEFLNKEAIIHELFDKLLSLAPKFDTTYKETKIFINDIRCIISDLKNYQIDLTAEEASLKLVSHIVFSKLPKVFRQELARKLDCNYPTVFD